MRQPMEPLPEPLDTAMSYAVLEIDPVLERLLEEYEGVVDMIVLGEPKLEGNEDFRHAAASLCRLSREIRLRVVELGERASTAHIADRIISVLERVDETKGRMPSDENVDRSLSNTRMRRDSVRDILDEH